MRKGVLTSPKCKLCKTIDIENEKKDLSVNSSKGSSVAVEVVRPPDGGWGWMVVLSSFLIHVIVDGIVYSFGVLLTDLVNFFKSGRGAVSWIGALQPAVMCTVGPLASLLTNKYGCKRVTIAGTFIAASGLMASSVVPNIYCLYFTSGIMAGVGFGLIYLPAIVSVSQYFEKKRSFAIGLAVCGSGFGTFIFAPITEVLVKEFGWQGAILIHSGIILNVVICGMILHPPEADDSPKRKLSFDSGIEEQINKSTPNRISQNKTVALPNKSLNANHDCDDDDEVNDIVIKLQITQTRTNEAIDQQALALKYKRDDLFNENNCSNISGSHGSSANTDGLKGESSEGESSQVQIPEVQIPEVHSSEGQSSEGQSSEGQSFEPQRSEDQSSDRQCSEGQSPQVHSLEGQSSERQSSVGQSSEGQSSEGQSSAPVVKGSNIEGKECSDKSNGDKSKRPNDFSLLTLAQHQDVCGNVDKNCLVSDLRSSQHSISEFQNNQRLILDNQSSQNPILKYQNSQNPNSEYQSSQNPILEYQNSQNYILTSEDSHNPILDIQGSQNSILESHSSPNSILESEGSQLISENQGSHNPFSKNQGYQHHISESPGIQNHISQFQHHPQLFTEHQVNPHPNSEHHESHHPLFECQNILRSLEEHLESHSRIADKKSANFLLSTQESEIFRITAVTENVHLPTCDAICTSQGCTGDLKEVSLKFSKIFTQFEQSYCLNSKPQNNLDLISDPSDILCPVSERHEISFSKSEPKDILCPVSEPKEIMFPVSDSSEIIFTVSPTPENVHPIFEPLNNKRLMSEPQDIINLVDKHQEKNVMSPVCEPSEIMSPFCKLQDITISLSERQEGRFSNSQPNELDFHTPMSKCTQFPLSESKGSQFPANESKCIQFPFSEHKETQFPISKQKYTQFPASEPRYGQFPASEPRYGQFPVSEPTYGQFPEVKSGERLSSFSKHTISIEGLADKTVESRSSIDQDDQSLSNENSQLMPKSQVKENLSFEHARSLQLLHEALDTQASMPESRGSNQASHAQSGSKLLRNPLEKADIPESTSAPKITLITLRTTTRKDFLYQGSLQNIPIYRSHPDLYREIVTMSSENDIRRISEGEPEKRKKPRELRSRIINALSLGLLKNPVFLMFAISNFFTSLGFNIPFIFLPDRATMAGIDGQRGALLLSVIGIANTEGRIIFGYLADRPWVNRLMLYNTALTICGAATAVSPFLGSDYMLLVTYAAVFGSFIGVYVSLTSVILVDLLGLEHLTDSFGLLLLFQGAATFIGPPIAGWLCDHTGNYDLSFYLMGSLIALSGVMLYFLPLVESYYAHSEKKVYTVRDLGFGKLPVTNNDVEIISSETSTLELIHALEGKMSHAV